jgi:hypothetical protein
LTNLDVPVDEPIQLDVVVVFSERINQNLGDFQPPDVEAELMEETNTIVNLHNYGLVSNSFHSPEAR